MPTVRAEDRPTLRADARRNRDQLLAIAVRRFSTPGAEVTLDSIAKEAGVGIGTLYRHFPTREALIDAAYQGELARLCDGVDDLLLALPPDRALRAWMDRFVDYITTKRGMSDALRAVIDAGRDPFSRSRARLVAAVTTLLTAGVQAGTVRDDLQPDDLLVSMSGVTMAAGDAEQAGRLLDLLMAGLQPGR